jgi:hypothetical protein
MAGQAASRKRGQDSADLCGLWRGRLLNSLHRRDTEAKRLGGPHASEMEGKTMPYDRIRHALEAKADALVRRATDELSALIDIDFVYVNARGVSFDKASYIEAYCVSGQVLFRRQIFRDIEVRYFPGFAIATLFVDDSLEVRGQIAQASHRSLCAFREFDNRWLWVAGQTMVVA